MLEPEARVKKEDVVLLLCRSGKRSALAAEAAAKAVGWRFHGLPWVQD